MKSEDIREGSFLIFDRIREYPFKIFVPAAFVLGSLRQYSSIPFPDDLFPAMYGLWRGLASLDDAFLRRKISHEEVKGFSSWIREHPALVSLLFGAGFGLIHEEVWKGLEEFSLEDSISYGTITAISSEVSLYFARHPVRREEGLRNILEKTWNLPFEYPSVFGILSGLSYLNIELSSPHLPPLAQGLGAFLWGLGGYSLTRGLGALLHWDSLQDIGEDLCQRYYLFRKNYGKWEDAALKHLHSFHSDEDSFFQLMQLARGCYEFSAYYEHDIAEELKEKSIFYFRSALSLVPSILSSKTMSYPSFRRRFFDFREVFNPYPYGSNESYLADASTSLLIQRGRHARFALSKIESKDGTILMTKANILDLLDEKKEADVNWREAFDCFTKEELEKERVRDCKNEVYFLQKGIHGFVLKQVYPPESLQREFCLSQFLFDLQKDKGMVPRPAFLDVQKDRERYVMVAHLARPLKDVLEDLSDEKEDLLLQRVLEVYLEYTLRATRSLSLLANYGVSLPSLDYQNDLANNFFKRLPLDLQKILSPKDLDSLCLYLNKRCVHAEHGDVHPGNFLVRYTKGGITLIDPEKMHAGHVLDGIAQFPQSGLLQRRRSAVGIYDTLLDACVQENVGSYEELSSDLWLRSLFWGLRKIGTGIKYAESSRGKEGYEERRKQLEHSISITRGSLGLEGLCLGRNYEEIVESIPREIRCGIDRFRESFADLSFV